MRRNVRLGLVASAIVLPFVFAVSAQATAGTPETINTHLAVTNQISDAPPYVLTDTGTFTASGAFQDSGTFSVKLLYAAVPSPSTSAVEMWQTLTDTHGDTLALRCALFTNDFSDWPDFVPFRGTCAVLSGTGQYDSLRGSAKVTGFVSDAATPPTLDTTVVLPTR